MDDESDFVSLLVSAGLSDDFSDFAGAAEVLDLFESRESLR